MQLLTRRNQVFDGNLTSSVVSVNLTAALKANVFPPGIVLLSISEFS